MSRNVTLAAVTLEVVKPDPAMSNLDLQDKIMDVVIAAGFEVHGTEVVFVRERRVPDKDVSANAAPAEAPHTDGS